MWDNSEHEKLAGFRVREVIPNELMIPRVEAFSETFRRENDLKVLTAILSDLNFFDDIHTEADAIRHNQALRILSSMGIWKPGKELEIIKLLLSIAEPEERLEE